MRVLSLLTPDEVRSLGGLPADAIVGGFTDGPDGEVFQANPALPRVLQDVVRSAGPQDAALCDAAARQGEGWVYVIDLRTPDGPQGQVQAGDIIGAFGVEHGRIDETSYEANDAYRAFTKHGLVQLPDSLRRAFLACLASGPRPTPGRR